MAYDEGVAQRIREALVDLHSVIEKKMFGGVAFMQSGNMLCGVIDNALMARVGPDQYAQALAQPHAREMDFTGRPMKGFVYVQPEGFVDDRQLRDWIALCENFVCTLPAK